MKLQNRWLSLTLGCFTAASCLVSCTQKDPGLLEKIALKEAELREKDARLQDLQQQLTQMAETSKSLQPKAPDTQAAKSNYSAYIDGLRDELTKKLPNSRIVRTSVFPIEEPNPERPIISKVAFEVKAANGNMGELTVPLYANASGKWHQSGDLDLSSLNEKLNAPPQIAKNNPTAPPPTPTPQAKPLIDVIGADETHQVVWDEDVQPPSPNQPRQTQQPLAPPAPAQPTAPTLPKKVMPTDRDVIIDFD